MFEVPLSVTRAGQRLFGKPLRIVEPSFGDRDFGAEYQRLGVGTAL